MKTILQLIDDKLFWYKKYLNCNEAYLIALKHAPEIALDEMDLFYGNRESLLKILESIDEKIQEKIKTEKRESTTDEKTKIQYYIREKDSIIQRIIELDKAIIHQMELLHASGEEKLRALMKGRKALSQYKSQSTRSEKIDKRV